MAGAGGGAHVRGRPSYSCLATPEWLDPEDNEDNGGAVKRFQLGLHYSLIYCDRPPRLAVTASNLHTSGLLHSAAPAMLKDTDSYYKLCTGYY